MIEQQYVDCDTSKLITRIENKNHLERLEHDLRTKHKEEIDRLSEENIEEMQNMLKDFEQGQVFLKKQISGLEKEYVHF